MPKKGKTHERPKKTPYTITEDDAYQIEGLISLLSMAVWEILRDKRQNTAWLYEAEDFSFVEQFEKEADALLFDPKF